MAVKAAAEKLEISLSLCYQLIAEGRLPRRRIGGRGKRGKIVVTEEELEKFLEACKAPEGDDD